MNIEKPEYSCGERDGWAPMVSVVMPGYNHAPYLRRRIDSILRQSFRDFELILLDDCSTDDSAEILEEYRDRPEVSHLIVNDHNSGSTFIQWRKGLELARGKYIWIAESDDYADERFLERLVGELEKHEDAILAFSGSRMVDADSREIVGMNWDKWEKVDPQPYLWDSHELIKRRLLYTADIYNASMVVFRRDKAPEIDAFQAGMKYAGDWLFWVRMLSREGVGIEIREKLNFFRQHENKVSTASSKNGRYFLEGLPIMKRVAEELGLSEMQRRVMAGRTLKRLGKFREFYKNHEAIVDRLLEELSPGAVLNRKALIWLYESDKFLNFSKLR